MKEYFKILLPLWGLIIFAFYFASGFECINSWEKELRYTACAVLLLSIMSAAIARDHMDDKHTKK